MAHSNPSTRWPPTPSARWGCWQRPRGRRSSRPAGSCWTGPPARRRRGTCRGSGRSAARPPTWSRPSPAWPTRPSGRASGALWYHAASPPTGAAAAADLAGVDAGIASLHAAVVADPDGLDVGRWRDVLARLGVRRPRPPGGTSRRPRPSGGFDQPCSAEAMLGRPRRGHRRRDRGRGRPRPRRLGLGRRPVVPCGSPTPSATFGHTAAVVSPARPFWRPTGRPGSRRSNERSATACGTTRPTRPFTPSRTALLREVRRRSIRPVGVVADVVAAAGDRPRRRRPPDSASAAAGPTCWSRWRWGGSGPTTPAPPRSCSSRPKTRRRARRRQPRSRPRWPGWARRPPQRRAAKEAVDRAAAAARIAETMRKYGGVPDPPAGTAAAEPLVPSPPPPPPPAAPPPRRWIDRRRTVWAAAIGAVVGGAAVGTLISLPWAGHVRPAVPATATADP